MVTALTSSTVGRHGALCCFRQHSSTTGFRFAIDDHSALLFVLFMGWLSLFIQHLHISIHDEETLRRFEGNFDPLCRAIFKYDEMS